MRISLRSKFVHPTRHPGENRLETLLPVMGLVKRSHYLVSHVTDCGFTIDQNFLQKGSRTGAEASWEGFHVR